MPLIVFTEFTFSTCRLWMEKNYSMRLRERINILYIYIISAVKTGCALHTGHELHTILWGLKRLCLNIDELLLFISNETYLILVL